MHVLQNSKDYYYKDSLKENINSKKILKNIPENENIYVSLSGGVDSMVLISILHASKYPVHALHVNYNNRQDANDEQRFLEKWCIDHNIPINVLNISLKRTETSRDNYEKYTKKLRYDFYKKHSSFVLLGHHKNDIIENVFANIMQSKSIFDLCSMSITSVINDITVYRPLIHMYKNEIYDIAHNYNIPYLKDSTPTWSIRGKLRNLFPMIENIYPNYESALYNLAYECNEWRSIGNNYIIQNIVSQVQYKGNDKNIWINFPYNQLIVYKSLCVWRFVISMAVHDMDLPMISNKALQELYSVVVERSCSNFKNKSIGKYVKSHCNTTHLTLEYLK